METDEAMSDTRENGIVDPKAIRRTSRRIADWLTTRDVAPPTTREALFLAGIEPCARGKTLETRRAQRLASALRRLAAEPSVRIGDAGSACPDCSTTLLQPTDEDLRWCTYCPRCQSPGRHSTRPSAEIREPSPTGTETDAVTTGEFRIGCALWSYAPWCGVLYPDKTPASDRLRLYGERFTCVEGNSFFYAQPSDATLARWVEETPEDFRFYPKFPRHVSHEGNLRDRRRTACDALVALDPIASRLGTVFLQLPPSFLARSLPDLHVFFEEVAAFAASRAIDLAVEFRRDELVRGPQADAADDFLREHSISRVILDTRAVFLPGDDPQDGAPRPKPQLVCDPRRTSDHVLLRFVAHPDLARNDAFMDSWADEVTTWLGEGVSVTFFAHCPDEQYSPLVARTFQSRLEARGAPVRALPWNELPPEPAQQSLF